MKTKLVYVLVSDLSGFYYEMLQMSLYSFRIYHPKDTVELVMDDDTFNRLEDIHADVLRDVIPVVVPIPSDYSIMQRSRYLKTNLRHIIKGDFLFIDTDTIICSSLEELDNMDFNVAMVADCNKPLPLTDPGNIELNRSAGFLDSKNLPYFNSGVVYVKDSPLAYCLFDEWHSMWKLSAQNGVSKDQPALCQANKNLNFPIQELSGIWNWQMWDNSLYYIFHTKVLHYYTAHEWKDFFWKRVNDNKKIDFYTKMLLRHPRLFSFMLYCKRRVLK